MMLKPFHDVPLFLHLHGQPKMSMKTKVESSRQKDRGCWFLEGIAAYFSSAFLSADRFSTAASLKANYEAVK
jgi:hypothetical protein